MIFLATLACPIDSNDLIRFACRILAILFVDATGLIFRTREALSLGHDYFISQAFWLVTGYFINVGCMELRTFFTLTVYCYYIVKLTAWLIALISLDI